MSLFPEFENSQIEVDLLPQLEEITLKPLQRNYLKAQMLLSLIWILILLIIISIIFIALPEWSQKKVLLFIATPIFLLIGVLPMIITYFGFYRKGYAVRQRDILYKTGLFWRKTVILPFIRIQHSEVTHGPIDRMYKLASLKLFTAGGSTSDLSIPGLLDVEAHKLKDYIAQKTDLDEEE
jgi:membrane protein YdbS with pleckstrin-like domain